jgi:hypothetical protein
MPTEDRFTPRPPETDTVYPESPLSPSVPKSDNPPGPLPGQAHMDQLEDQNVKPGQTGKMPGVTLDPGRQDEGPTVSPEDQGPGATANSGY